MSAKEPYPVKFPEWAAVGNKVAILRSGGNWVIGTVESHTKSRINVRVGDSRVEQFYQPKHHNSWVEHGTGGYYADVMYELDGDQAQAGFRLTQRKLAARAVLNAAKEFVKRSPDHLAVEDAEQLVSQLQHFITFVKAQEVNSATEG